MCSCASFDMNCEIIKHFNGNLDLFSYISFYNELYDYFTNWIKVTGSIVYIVLSIELFYPRLCLPPLLLVNWVIVGSGNDLLLVQCQAITWHNAAWLSIAPLGTNFSELEIVIQSFSLIKKCLKMSSVKWKWWQFCPGADELIMNILMCHWLNLPCWTPWYIECD